MVNKGPAFPSPVRHEGPFVPGTLYGRRACTAAVTLNAASALRLLTASGPAARKLPGPPGALRKRYSFANEGRMKPMPRYNVSLL